MRDGIYVFVSPSGRILGCIETDRQAKLVIETAAIYKNDATCSNMYI